MNNKWVKILGIIVIIILVILSVKYFMCKNNKDKVLGASGNSSASPQDLLNAAKPCNFFSLK